MRVSALLKVSGLGLLVGTSLMLTGCSESRETRAAKACIKELEAKIDKDEPYKADIAAIAASAKADGTDMFVIESEATIDAAQANESTQKFICRVQFDPGKPDAEPTVILFLFDY